MSDTTFLNNFYIKDVETLILLDEMFKKRTRVYEYDKIDNTNKIVLLKKKIIISTILFYFR